jgi:hypothetical protein
MGNPKNLEAQEKAFEAMVPNITLIKTFYDLAHEIGRHISSCSMHETEAFAKAQ